MGDSPHEGHRAGHASNASRALSAQSLSAPLPSTLEALVVGGGPAGLALTDALAGRGIRTALVERSGVLGGMARSFRVDDLVVDLGSHRLHPVADRNVEQLLHELLGDDLQTRRRHGRIRLAGRWVRFPLRTPDLLRHLPLGFAVNAARDTVAGPGRRRRSPAPSSFADVVRMGLGPTMLAEFYGPFAAKLWGVSAEHLDGELARRRIAASTPSALVSKLLPRPGGATFRYPRLGYGQVVETLAARAVRRGAIVQTDRHVVAIRPGIPPSVIFDDGTVLSPRRVFWTGPPTGLAAVVTATVPGIDTSSAPQPPHHGCLSPPRAMVCVYVSFPVGQISPFDAHYLPGTDVRSSRISEPKNYRDGPDPDDRTVLCAEVPCDVDDDVWSADDDALATLVRRDLSTVGMNVPEPTMVRSERLPAVYPVIRTGDVATVDALRTWSHALPGVTTLGRHGLIVADNLHHVLAMALDAADCFGPEGIWNGVEWLRARRRFERFVVED